MCVRKCGAKIKQNLNREKDNGRVRIRLDPYLPSPVCTVLPAVSVRSEQRSEFALLLANESFCSYILLSLYRELKTKIN